MNKKKIMVLLVLLVAVVGFTMASVSAASTQSKTFTVNLWAKGIRFQFIIPLVFHHNII